MNDSFRYKMSVDLNVLNHLGIGLYSNIPAVLSEAVANAWDADASSVKITLDKGNDSITVQDDGNGMSVSDANEKFLKVGYRKREVEGGKSRCGRDIMGRKGIGKLSLFSIADEIQVHTIHGEDRHAFKMESDSIRAAIDTQNDYHPAELPADTVDFTVGTRLSIRKLKAKRMGALTKDALRQRIARRFSVVGGEGFKVFVNDEEVGPKDRGDFKPVQFLWTLGPSSEYEEYCPNLVKKEVLDNEIILPQSGKKVEVRGWFGTVSEPRELKTPDGNLNSIVVLARGRLVQEDILSQINIGGLYTKYVTGQIEADFLDEDGAEDIVTSDRQRVMEDDSRYRAVLEFVRNRVNSIEKKWSNWRKEVGFKDAITQFPILESWIDSLATGSKPHAKKLVATINALTLDKVEDKRSIFRHGILAFERLRLREEVESLTDAMENGVESLLPILMRAEDLEAALYLDIVRGRLDVIKGFMHLVDDNAKERLLQEYIFKYLWLLDPSWERATGSERMETLASKEFDKIDATNLTAEEKKGRIDIKYRTTAGVHLIIELKRSSVVTSVAKLVSQGRKYRNATQKLLETSGKKGEPVRLIYVLGRPVSEEKDPDSSDFIEKQLESVHGRILYYETLIGNSQKAYGSYLDAHKTMDKIESILAGLSN